MTQKNITMLTGGIAFALSFLIYALFGGGIASVAATLMLMSFLLPVFAIALDNIPKILSAFLGVVIFALFVSMGCLGAAFKSIAIIAAYTTSLIAVIRLLKKYIPIRVAIAIALIYVLLGVSMPAWSRDIIKNTDSLLLVDTLLHTSPLVGASVSWTSATTNWSFDIRTGNLYDSWIGTDVLLIYPAWWMYLVSHLICTLLCVGVWWTKKITSD